MNEIPENLQFEHLIWQTGVKVIVGIDEVGRGPLAGPVVAAAAVFEPETHIEGVTDSKKLSAKKRELYYEQIIETCKAYALGVVDNEEIDRINIRQATFKAMRKAIGSLGITPEYLLVDGEEMPGKIYPQEALVKGDLRSFTIASASIIAKVTRDRMMLDYHEQFPQYGFDSHKGYGTAAHIAAIKAHGPTPIHRRSFLTRIYPESASESPSS